MKFRYKNAVCPIISFYSYKGGVGRTTALAAFAAFYASTYEKKVVMIDCDFEAPGFANHLELDKAPPTNGVLEFLLDRQFAGDEVKLPPYVIQVDKKYSGNGEIYAILAGNLSSEIAIPDAPKYGSHFKHYLEGISRLNISGQDQMFEHMSDLLDEVNQEFAPDLILIDTRNGINDIFGNIGLPFSSVMVGIFNNDFQSLPGMRFFLNIGMQSEFATILVNSHTSEAKLPDSFKQKVQLLFQKVTFPEDKTQALKMSYIMKDARLDNVGTTGDNALVNLIKGSPIYQHFFETVVAQLDR